MSAWLCQTKMTRKEKAAKRRRGKLSVGNLDMG